MFGRYPGGRPGAEHSDLHRIHHRKRRTVIRVAQHNHTLNAGQPESLFVVSEIPVDLCREVWLGEFEPRRLDMKPAVSGTDAKHARLHRFAFRVRFECLFDRCHAFLQTEQRGHVSSRKDHRSTRLHALSLESKRSRFEPGSISIGSCPRRKIRADLIPLRTTASPSTHSIDPSRSPATGVSFSSRNWLIRSS